MGFFIVDLELIAFSELCMTFQANRRKEGAEDSATTQVFVV